MARKYHATGVIMWGLLTYLCNDYFGNSCLVGFLVDFVDCRGPWPQHTTWPCSRK